MADILFTCWEEPGKVVNFVSLVGTIPLTATSLTLVQTGWSALVGGVPGVP